MQNIGVDVRRYAQGAVYVQGMGKHQPMEAFKFRVDYVYRGYVVTQLVEALCYKPEVRGFDSRWFHWNYSFT
jgi:hypothetical protein